MAVSAIAQSVGEGKETPSFPAGDSQTHKHPDYPHRIVQPSVISLTPPGELLRHVAPAFGRYENAFALVSGIAVIPYGEREAFIGTGGYDRAGAMLRWQLSESVSLGGGGFADRQYSYRLTGGQNAFGANAALDWAVSGRLRLGLHGNT
ncbi:MAG: hypothetical protein LBK07_01665 [Tannerella sp.]|nr:hypothetical protein [Tannerella sp.]